jgi:hypothetical protein
MEEMHTYTSTILARLDAVHLALVFSWALCKSKQRHVSPVLLSIVGAHAACSVTFGAVADDIVDGVWSRLLLDEDNRLFLTWHLDTILGRSEELGAALGREELDESVSTARRRHGNGFESAAPH